MDRTKQKRRPLKIVLIVLAVLLLIGGALAFIGNYFYHFALDPASDSFFGGGDEPGEDGEPTPAELWFEGGETVQMESEDGLTLAAYQFFGQPGRRYVIACHGYGNRASGIASSAYQFYEMGFNVLLPDARGHGQSEGEYVGMGWHERRDVIGWCNYILSREPRAEIILYGLSMGAATVMMASGEADLPSAVKLVIEDCGYTSVWDEFAAQLDDLYSLPPVPILNATSVVTRIKAGWWLEQASALEQVKNCTIPILFIHGEADAFVPYEMVHRLYAAASCPKALFTVPGAAHAQSASVDPDGYWNAVRTFLSEHLPAVARGR